MHTPEVGDIVNVAFLNSAFPGNCEVITVDKTTKKPVYMVKWPVGAVTLPIMYVKCEAEHIKPCQKKGD